MLNKILTRLLATPSRKETLQEILSDPFHREGLLGVRRDPPPTPERIIQDNEKIINFSKTKDYAVWAQETWSQLLNCMDKLANPDTDGSQVDYYRGALAQCIDSLRISYRAIAIRDDAKDKSKRQ